MKEKCKLPSNKLFAPVYTNRPNIQRFAQQLVLRHRLTAILHVFQSQQSKIIMIVQNKMKNLSLFQFFSIILTLIFSNA